MDPGGIRGGHGGRLQSAALLLVLVPALLPVTSAHGGEPPAVEAAADFLPLDCVAEQTGGFHDYPDDDESYQPALFNAAPFRLEENVVFMLNLPETPGIDLYVSLTAGEDPVTTELECRRVRGVDGSPGFSCVNIPPSEMLLINADTLRFTRTAVGGWTFAGATEVHNGDSIFVEYGTCAPPGPQPGAGG
ncbi:MAG: hypothetical protein U5Q16_15615 [Gammaproteobacteria bacterium]|nr:hypothetical protein [Gammaproteobacteria bacterium]